MGIAVDVVPFAVSVALYATYTTWVLFPRLFSSKSGADGVYSSGQRMRMIWIEEVCSSDQDALLGVQTF